MGVTDSKKIAHNALTGITGVEDVHIYFSLVSLFLTFIAAQSFLKICTTYTQEKSFHCITAYQGHNWDQHFNEFLKEICPTTYIL